METWFFTLISLCIAAIIKALFKLLHPTKTSSHRLPPGPSTFQIIRYFLFHGKTDLDFESFVRSLRSKMGPVITLHLDSPMVIISDRSLIHQALIQNGAVFADRPPVTAIRSLIGSNQQSISSAAYGPTWRLLRRNLMAEILHPSRVESYSHGRKWVLQILLDGLNGLNSKSKSVNKVRVIDHVQYALFCLLVLMCFGEKLDQQKIKQVEDVQRRLVLNSERFRILKFWSKLTKVLFYKRWKELLQIRKQQENVLMPLIENRRKVKQDDKEVNGQYVISYVDTLFDLELPEEKRKLDENEIMSLCSEFLSAGTDSTATALQWVMANLVKYPHIQEKLFSEIKEVVRDAEREVKEEDIQKMPYLKAVILESLRRHPPGHFGVPHAVTEDVVLNRFLVPKNASILFMIADMGWDSKVFDNPMAFKPERFLNGRENKEAFDITGIREIKMMPFGVGRRICPGLGLAMLHLEYFVANLIWNYEWKAVDGDEVNLEEKSEFTILMKNPLEAHLNPRFK